MARKDTARNRGERTRERSEPSPHDARFVWGINPVLEALRARPDEIDRLQIADGQLPAGVSAELLARAREAGLRVERVPREALMQLSGGGVHQGVVALLRAFQYSELEDLLAIAKDAGVPPLLVVLDGVQDPHNLGAIVRSAHALGAHGVIIPKDRAVAVTGVVAKASAGAIEHLAIARVTNLSRTLETLKQEGLWIAAADPEGSQTLWQANLDGPLAIVVGAEGPGVRKGVLEHCDFRLQIPMVGKVASLNASVSAALLLGEVARQRASGSNKRA